MRDRTTGCSDPGCGQCACQSGRAITSAAMAPGEGARTKVAGLIRRAVELNVSAEGCQSIADAICIELHGDMAADIERLVSAKARLEDERGDMRGYLCRIAEVAGANQSNIGPEESVAKIVAALEKLTRTEAELAALRTKLAEMANRPSRDDLRLKFEDWKSQRPAKMYGFTTEEVLDFVEYQQSGKGAP